MRSQFLKNLKKHDTLYCYVAVHIREEIWLGHRRERQIDEVKGVIKVFRGE